MDENWTRIFTSQHLYKVEILKAVLEENNINSIIINKKDSSYHFGEVELYVTVEDAFTARQIIAKSEGE